LGAVNRILTNSLRARNWSIWNFCMKGRPDKPTKLKALQGNAGKRLPPAPDGDVPAPEISEEVFFSPGWQPAAWLPEGAKQIWREQLPIALRETKLQQSGLQVFATYCDALYRVHKYTRLIEEKGATYTTASGYERKRPEVEMRDAAVRDMRIYASELNMTPKSWINSMGTFSGRQLDMFMNGGRAPAPIKPDMQGATPTKGESLDAFLGAKPTLQ
jgi:P27 family predicted phage terminase small subunit